MAKAESKSEAFKRLATLRTNAVLQRLRVLGHCANPQLYEYSDEEVKKIFRSIRAELRAVEAKFTNSAKSEFHL